MNDSAADVFAVFRNRGDGYLTAQASQVEACRYFDFRFKSWVSCSVADFRFKSWVSCSVADYVELVEWSGRQVREGKRGVITSATPRALARLGLPEREWQTQMLGIESRYWRAVGTIESLMEKAKALGQSWLKGTGRATQAAYR